MNTVSIKMIVISLACVGSSATYAGTIETVTYILPSGDTSGATDAANLTTAEAALPATGGSILLGPGDFYLPPPGLNFTKPTLLAGQGSSDAYGYGYGLSTGNAAATTINFNYSSGSAVTYSGAASGCDRIHFRNQTAAQQGAAIVLNGASGSFIHNCSTYGFYSGIVVTGGTVGYTLAFNKLYSPHMYGIWINNTLNSDEGDPQIFGNMIVSGLYPGSAAAVFYQSGGGAKFVGNKINSDVSSGARNDFQYGIWMQPPSTSHTGVVVLTGNSIENLLNDSIFVDNSAGGNFGNIVVTGNELLADGAGLHAADYPFSMVFVGNIVNAKNFVESEGELGMVVSSNVGSATGAMVAGAGFALGVDLATNVLSSPAHPQILMTDFSYADTGNNVRTGGNRYVTREIPNLAPVGAVAPIYAVTVPAGHSVIVELDLAGTMSGAGGYAHRLSRAITNNAGSLSVVPVGTDFNTGTALVTWTFTDAGGGACQISINAKTGVGLTTSTIPGVGNGEINMRVYGLPSSIVRN